VWLCAASADSSQLHVRFAGEHRHRAQVCKVHRRTGCVECPLRNQLPVTEPYGHLNGLFGAMVFAACSALMPGFDAGASESTTALFRTSAARTPAAELVSGNRARCGSSVENFASLAATERLRIMDRQGGALPTPAAQGGPQESVGRVAEQLVRGTCVLAWRRLADACVWQKALQIANA
jgi:hypothetical protein